MAKFHISTLYMYFLKVMKHDQWRASAVSTAIEVVS